MMKNEISDEAKHILLGLKAIPSERREVVKKYLRDLLMGKEVYFGGSQSGDYPRVVSHQKERLEAYRLIDKILPVMEKFEITEGAGGYYDYGDKKLIGAKVRCGLYGTPGSSSCGWIWTEVEKGCAGK